MNAFTPGWFSELSPLWPGQCMSLQIEEVLFTGKSEFQEITVLKTKSHGRMLVLDGAIQCTEADEFAYQEMISFLPLCSHPNPQKVLIIGGGGGGVAREVAKHPSVEHIVQCEIDEKVVEVSKRYLPSMAEGFASPKLVLHIGDGLKFMEQHEKEFDVIITDSSDPIGPAETLFREEYFQLMSRALRPGGIICSQGEAAWASLDLVTRTLSYCRNCYPSTDYGIASVPTYPTGQIGFILGSKDKNTSFREPLHTWSTEQLEAMNLRYYSPEVHRAAFALPRFLRKAVDVAVSKQTNCSQ